MEDGDDLREMLGTLGAVDVAKSASEERALFQRRTFDAVLSDIRLPGGMVGIALVDEVSTIMPRTVVLLMSGFSDQNQTRTGHIVLSKPIPLLILGNAVVLAVRTKKG